MMSTFPPSLSFHVSTDPFWRNEVLAKHKMHKVVKTILQKDLCQLYCTKNSVALTLWKSAMFVHVFSYIFCRVMPNFFGYLTNLIAISSTIEMSRSFHITWTKQQVYSVVVVDIFFAAIIQIPGYLPFIWMIDSRQIRPQAWGKVKYFLVYFYSICWDEALITGQV